MGLFAPKPQKFKIVGLEELVFGVADVDTCDRYLRDYGLTKATDRRGRALYAGADGTGLILGKDADEDLPKLISPGVPLRQIVFGVADKGTLSAIQSELRRDRDVTVADDGTIETVDDLGFNIAFRITARRQLPPPPFPMINVTGTEPDMPAVPQSLSHIVLFVPDSPKAEAFYVNRLGFRVTDRYTGAGPFLRAPGAGDHHCLFLIQTPPHMKGVDHFTFHMRNVVEVMMAGHRFSAKGYQTHWGPGRHYLGSNWFWYFNSPFGCAMEYDAEMDQHDDQWQPRELPVNADTLQLFLLQERDKWAPGPGAH